MAVWDNFTTDKQWEEYLKQLVKTNDKALYKAIVIIYNNQTEEEKVKQESVEDNNVGFTKWDAKELGNIARKIIGGEQLTSGEIAKSRNKMQKYWKQLMIVSKRQIATRAQQELVERQKISKQHFQDSLETLRRCSEQGTPCEFGICDECPVAQGLQMRLVGGETNEDEK